MDRLRVIFTPKPRLKGEKTCPPLPKPCKRTVHTPPMKLLRKLHTRLLVLLSVAIPTMGYATSVTVAFNSTDCTAAIQAALNGTADTIIIPNTVPGSPWITGPLTLSRNGVTLRLDTGVVFQAKSGAFPNPSDCLLALQTCSNIIVTGYGATFRMLNGTDTAYTSGEWRHTLGLFGVDKVRVEGLTFTKAGGDGVYIAGDRTGAAPNYSSDVTIQDCQMDDNRRQGISVISAQDLLVQRCVLSNTGVTSGTAPMAGIDFEPDNAAQRLVNCVLRDCYIYGNTGTTAYPSGIHSYLGNLTTASQPVSLSFERCLVTSTRTAGSTAVEFGGANDSGVPATFTMTDCLIEDTKWIGLYIRSSAVHTTVNVTRTVLRNTFTDTVSWGGVPIYLEGQRPGIAAYGNITFTDCLVVDGQSRAFLRTDETRTGLPNGYFDGLRGNITVVNPNPAGRVWNLDFANDVNVTLAVTGLASMPLATANATVLQSTVSEGQVGTFRVARPSSTSAAARAFPLAVEFSLSGTASNRSDYGFQPGFVMLPPYVMAPVSVSIRTRADNVAEPSETTVLTLTARPSDYTIGTGTATLSIQ